MQDIIYEINGSLFDFRVELYNIYTADATTDKISDMFDKEGASKVCLKGIIIQESVQKLLNNEKYNR